MVQLKPFKYSSGLATVMVAFCLFQQSLNASPCPCDIYAAGATPCVAAHSMVRALYSAYDGPLYQVKRTADKVTKDIKLLTPGGYVNAAVQDSFLAGKPGTISIIYDQSPKGNHLKASPIGGWLYSGGVESNAADTAIMINGHKAYGCYTQPKRQMGYRDNEAVGLATGSQSEGMYMVASGKGVNDSCCYDYGNAETNMKDNGTGTMEAIFLGKFCWFGPCSGNGPWILADLENGLFGGGTNGQNMNNTSVPYDYVTAIVKGDKSTYSIRGGNAQSGVLKNMAANASRPAPNKLEGALILGVGGDNSWAGRGIFFEGAVTIGKPSDTTEDAVQKNIIAAGYGSNTPTSLFNGNSPETMMQLCFFSINYNRLNTNVIIKYALREAYRVDLSVYNQQGRLIAVVRSGVLPAGRHESVWNANGVPAGIYVCRATLDGIEGWTGKIIVSK